MTSLERPSPTTPAAAWENEGGALAPLPGADAPAILPSADWRDLATFGAVMAAWPDLSVNVRRRITSDAIVAMDGVDLRHEPRA